jgi:hypothetical protein
MSPGCVILRNRWCCMASTLVRFIPMWVPSMGIFIVTRTNLTQLRSQSIPSGLSFRKFQWTCCGRQQTLSGDVRRIVWRTMELSWLMLSFKRSHHTARFSSDFTNLCFLYRVRQANFLFYMNIFILTENKLPISQIYIIRCTLLPLCAKKVGTNYADKQRSLIRYIRSRHGTERPEMAGHVCESVTTVSILTV